MIVPTCFAPSSNPRAVRSVSICLCLAFGGPKGLPKRWGVSKTLGNVIPANVLRKARIAMMTVAISASSNNLAKCPTDT